MELTNRILQTVLEAARPVPIFAAMAWMVGKDITEYQVQYPKGKSNRNNLRRYWKKCGMKVGSYRII